jgi:hypothetical protein
LNLEYLGLHTTTEDVETANNHRVNGNFDTTTPSPACRLN